MPHGIAILGAGIWAREQFLQPILENPSLTLKAVYSRSRASCEALLSSQNLSSYEVVTYHDDNNGPSWTQILTRDDIIGVVIALPINAQPEFIKKCLAAGKHVISEKPISPNTKIAKELIESYKSQPEDSRPMWGCTEDYRYMDSFMYGRQQIEKLGKIITFSVNMYAWTERDNKYVNTSWRAKPEFQGGFLLDGGVHYTSGLRMLLDKQNPITKVSAFQSLSQQYLAPYDTLSATVKLKDGINGTFAVCFSSKNKFQREMEVQCEGGYVIVTQTSVKTCEKEGEEVEKTFDRMGPKEEIDGFAESLNKGSMDGKMNIDEAYNDLLVLEQMLNSANDDGIPKDVEEISLGF